MIKKEYWESSIVDIMVDEHIPVYESLSTILYERSFLGYDASLFYDFDDDNLKSKTYIIQNKKYKDYIDVQNKLIGRYGNKFIEKMVWRICYPCWQKYYDHYIQAGKLMCYSAWSNDDCIIFLIVFGINRRINIGISFIEKEHIWEK